MYVSISDNNIYNMMVVLFISNTNVVTSGQTVVPNPKHSS